MINGIINVYKERGFTSHDVVAKLRGILHQKKIGHTGTLDPDAVGVLPVCLGNGTRLCDMLTDTDKVYRATMLLGMSTDTQDTSGKILSETHVDHITMQNVEDAILSFVGEYDQIPPMYSALKVNGKKLYELAREGKEVERASRRVNIIQIDIQDIQYITINPEIQIYDTKQAGIPFGDVPNITKKISVTMTVACSKGTYIRTLTHDIGQKLGVGGCMSALSRERVGIFDIDDAKTLSQIQQLADKNCHMEMVTPVDQMFLDLPSVQIKQEFVRLLYNGNPFYENQAEPENSPMSDGQQVRVYDPQGVFTGIYSYDKKYKQFKVVKMFL